MPSSQGDSRSEDALCYKLDGLRSHDCERGQAPASVMSAAPMAHYLAAIDSGVSHHVSSLFRKASRQTERRTPMAYTGMKIPMPKATFPCVTLQELRPFSEDWGCPFYGVLLSLSVFPGPRRGERRGPETARWGMRRGREWGRRPASGGRRGGVGGSSWSDHSTVHISTRSSRSLTAYSPADPEVRLSLRISTRSKGCPGSVYLWGMSSVGRPVLASKSMRSSGLCRSRRTLESVVEWGQLQVLVRIGDQEILFKGRPGVIIHPDICTLVPGH